MKLIKILDLLFFRAPMIRHSCFRREFIGGTTYELQLYGPPALSAVSLKTSSGAGVFRSRTSLLIDFDTSLEMAEALRTLLLLLSQNPTDNVQGNVICPSLVKYDFKAIRKGDELWFRVYTSGARKWGLAYPIELLEKVKTDLACLKIN